MDEKIIMHRQGDVLFLKVAGLPAALIERKSPRDAQRAVIPEQ